MLIWLAEKHLLILVQEMNNFSENVCRKRRKALFDFEKSDWKAGKSISSSLVVAISKRRLTWVLIFRNLSSH